MRFSVRVDAQNAQAALTKAPSLLRRRIADALWRGALEVARDARSRAPKAFSTLTNAILTTKIDDLHLQVDAGVNYAEAVELGRAPGKMPGAGLSEWVRQKTGLQGNALDRKTFVIARAIGRRGIRPQPFMQPAAEAKASRVVQLVQAAVTSGVQEIMA